MVLPRVVSLHLNYYAVAKTSQKAIANFKGTEKHGHMLRWSDEPEILVYSINV